MEKSENGTSVRGSSIIKQIAQEAGCAVSTVSRVINGNRKNFSVRPALEQKILELARQFEYQPNPFLQHMRTQTPRIIAIFDPLRTFSILNQQAKAGFIDSMKNKGYMTVGSYVEVHRLHDYTVPFPISGALLFDIGDKSFLDFFEKRRTPYVVINGLALENGTATLIDESRHAEWLIGHLFEQGHRRIVYFSSHKDAGTACQHYSGIQRQERVWAELQLRNLPLPDLDGNVFRSAMQFLEHHVIKKKATAVVCYDHVRVQQIYQAAWKLQLRIPEDFSVVSFDDDITMQNMAPPTTACTVSGFELGESAAKLLLDKLEKSEKNSSGSVVCTGKLTIRQSVAKQIQ